MLHLFHFCAKCFLCGWKVFAIKCVNSPDISTAQSTVLDLFYLDVLSTDLERKLFRLSLHVAQTGGLLCCIGEVSGLNTNGILAILRFFALFLKSP
jgi:hypothetical protein